MAALLLLAGSSLAPVWASDTAPLRRAEARPAPGLVLPLLQGGEARLAELQGEVVLVHFWATWCTPCLRELPSLQALWRERRDHGVQVLAVAADRRAAVAAFAATRGLELPVLLDTYGEAMRASRVRALPYTAVIDRNGQIRGAAAGQVDWDGPAVRELLDELTR